MPQAILFDLDGTLLDTEPDFTTILNLLLERNGRPAVDAGLVRRVVSTGATAMVRQGFGLPDGDPGLPVLLGEFLDLYSTQIPQTRASLFADIDLLLSRLHEQGVTWGIMTNKPRRFSEPLLSRFESFASSGTLVCADDVGMGKPDPAGLLLACRQLGLRPGEVCYVGDHPRDIEAASRAGMHAVAVSWGYLPDTPAIADWGADFVAHTPADLLRHLQLQGS